MQRRRTNKRYIKSFVLGGALVAFIVAAFAAHSLKFSDSGSASDVHRSKIAAMSFADVRHEEEPTPPPSHPAPQKGAQQFFVAPDGQSGGDGSKNRPWDLATALAQPAKVKPGDTIWMRGGMYKGAFISRLNGRDGQPVFLSQFTNERATIDGSLVVKGVWTTYWGFEVTDSDTDRTRERATGVEIFGAHTKFINLVVHDCGNGIAFWSPALDAELYGNIIYNNGWQSSSDERGHGHGLYTQNEEGMKLVRENILFNQFGWGIHAYTEEGEINGFQFEGNVSFNNGAATEKDERYDNILVGGDKPAARISLANNYTYQTLTRSDTKPNVRLHYRATNNQDLSVRNNYFVGGSLVLSVRDWRAMTLTGNHFYGLQQLLALGVPQDVSASTYAWDDNTYIQGKEAKPFSFQDNSLAFAEWQKATGIDRNSHWVNNPKGRPEGVVVFVRPNIYETGRAHLIVYNWDLKETAEVDVKGLLSVGARYEIRDAQNYFGAPVASGTYQGKPLRLPLTNSKVAPLVGGQFRFTSTAPEFGVFILLRKADG